MNKQVYFREVYFNTEWFGKTGPKRQKIWSLLKRDCDFSTISVIAENYILSSISKEIRLNSKKQKRNSAVMIVKGVCKLLSLLSQN